MGRLLIVYGTTEGHTRRVADFIAACARENGYRADVVDTARRPWLPGSGAYDGVVIAASVHGGRHQESAVRFVRENLRTLEHMPTAFFSVSLSAAGTQLRQRQGARRCADGFLRATGWRPSLVRLVAGALAYSRYGFLKRQAMRLIAWREGGDTDTSRDHEYTDWARLREDVELFLTHAVPADEPAEEPAEEPATVGAA